MTETRAEWLEGRPWSRHAPGQITPERIRLMIRNLRGIYYVYVGDWVVLRQDGSIDHLRNQDFLAEGYVQV